ncbi:MAG: VTT domain-containing protein [Chthoniobacterales bacterium]
MLGLVGLALLVAARVLPVLAWLETFRLWAQHFGIAGIFIYGALFAVVSIFLLPVLPLTLLAGFTFGLGGGLFAIMFGITLSAAFGFLFSRYAARAAVARRMERYPRFHAMDRAIAHEGWKIVGLLRMCPVPFGISNYLYGLTAIPFWHYMAATLIGMLPGNIMYVYLGVLGKRTAEGPRDPLEYIAGGVTLLALVGVTFVLRRVAQRAADKAGVN